MVEVGWDIALLQITMSSAALLFLRHREHLFRRRASVRETASLPLLGFLVVLAAAAKETVPAPVPEVAKVSRSAEEDTLHPQPVRAVMWNESDPSAEIKDSLAGALERGQAVCFTVKIIFLAGTLVRAMIMVPVLCLPALLTETV